MKLMSQTFGIYCRQATAHSASDDCVVVLSTISRKESSMKDNPFKPKVKPKAKVKVHHPLKYTGSKPYVALKASIVVHDTEQ